MQEARLVLQRLACVVLHARLQVVLAYPLKGLLALRRLLRSLGKRALRNAIVGGIFDKVHLRIS